MLSTLFLCVWYFTAVCLVLHCCMFGTLLLCLVLYCCVWYFTAVCLILYCCVFGTLLQCIYQQKSCILSKIKHLSDREGLKERTMMLTELNSIRSYFNRVRCRNLTSIACVPTDCTFLCIVDTIHQLVFFLLLKIREKWSNRQYSLMHIYNNSYIFIHV